MSDIRIFSAMQEGKPIKSYIKTVPSKVYVTILNPFSENPDGVILIGDPKKGEDSCIVDIWSDKEDVFFRRMNKKHFEKGTIIPYTRKEEIVISEEERLNSLSDEELTSLLNDKYFTLQSTVNKITSQVPLYRMVALARELEKSEKIINLLEGRLASLDAE